MLKEQGKVMALETLSVERLFAPGHSIAWELFEKAAYPWEALDELSGFIEEAGPTLGEDFERRGEAIWVARDADIAPTAFIDGPCIIDRGAQLRHGAFIRGRAVIGKGCVVGNSTEIKNSILMDGAQAPHFNYVGDSVLGWRAHIGAGVITSNIKCDKTPVTVAYPGGRLRTGLRKLGAMIGDGAEIGCGSVLCPGAVVGCGALVYPLCRVRGWMPGGHILKEDCRIYEKHAAE